MTLFRLGYVAMSVNLQECSPSKTMTFTQFNKLADKSAAINRLERITQENIANCLRLLKHNLAHDVSLFRLSSRLVPLATHAALAGWDYLGAIAQPLKNLGELATKNQVRLDFHPDHFVLINSPKEEVYLASTQALHLHARLLNGMGLDLVHRCVMHVGGNYKNTKEALERFITNWNRLPENLQEMIMLENDDKTFDLQDTLYVCEKLGIPMVFDYHHHLVNHRSHDWLQDWQRVLATWSASPFPVKIHISSPKSSKEPRSHADFICPQTFLEFVRAVNGSTPQVDCMVEAKMKDQALFNLMDALGREKDVTVVDGASFQLKND